MLKYQRIEREKSFREFDATRRFEAVAIVRIDQHRRAVQTHYSGIAAARDVSGEICLHAALTEHRCTEMPGSLRHECDRCADAIEANSSERNRVRTKDEGTLRLFGNVGEQHGAAHA